ncbi:MAG: gluconate 2-dehydrogenase subunit 3 family protein [Saprospiraceae bacterium]|nr:gluconate 2-dehydrogenase subunit 3 family protein [Saprospiraceae bacterium]
MNEMSHPDRPGGSFRYPFKTFHEHAIGMTRREAFQNITLLLGGVTLAPELLANALNTSADDLRRDNPTRSAILDEMAETIIPATDTPGAKAAKVGDFVLTALETCLPEKRKIRFWEDFENAETACRRKYGKSYVELDQPQRFEMMSQWQALKPMPGDEMPTFFKALKILVLHGYFTSEIGATQALSYDPIPGEWIADLPITSDSKAWTPLF